MLKQNKIATEKTPGQDDFTGEYCQWYEEKNST